MAWVANAGGQTRARVYGATHSQITLTALRFSPANGAPGGANASPLPLGSPPRGSAARWIAAATALADRSGARGKTCWKRAIPPENPDSPGSHSGWPCWRRNSCRAYCNC